jgi:hypothetical protein
MFVLRVGDALRHEVYARGCARALPSGDPFDPELQHHAATIRRSQAGSRKDVRRRHDKKEHHANRLHAPGTVPKFRLSSC